MRLQSKLFAVLVVVFAVLYLLVEYHQYRENRSAIVEYLEQEAELLASTLLAVRQVYRQKLIAAELPLNEKTLDLLPAHALPDISMRFRELVGSGLSFNNVSDRPRNKKNRADAVEVEAIDYFRSKPSARFRMVAFVNNEGEKYFHYAKPLRIDRNCLQCHGKREEAPEIVRSLYDRAYDYELGDLSGILSIKLPVDALEQRALRLQLREMAHRLPVFVLVFFLLYWLLQKQVIQRLGRIRQQIQRLRDGDYTARVRVSGSDELCEMALAFNAMAEAIASTEGRLRPLSKVVEQSPASIILTDAQGTIEYVNPKFEEVSGYRLDEVRGKTPRVLKSGHTSEVDYRRLWNTVLSGEIWRGELLNRRKDGKLFWEYATIAPIRNEAGAIEHFISVNEDITLRKEYEQRLQHQENHDALTNLPNRSLIADRLAQAVLRAHRDKRQIAVISLDLDNFKIINDSLGHHCGDTILIQVAHRLRAILPEAATLARIGGDEFLVILPELVSIDSLDNVLSAIRRLFAQAFVIESGQTLYLQVSMGISVMPDDGSDAYLLLRNADTAMHRAKELGRNQTQFFAQEMNVSARERLEMQSHLRHALERGEFSLHYQPQINAVDGTLRGAEALLRWNSPALGQVSPDQFIPLAEENGLILPIGYWVLETACAEAARWPEHLRISVNVSARQFRDKALLEKISAALASSGIAAHRLELEVTESLLLENLDETAEMLQDLRSLGVHIALDDFGTGYSSLSYLRRFPFGILKIDRSFISDILADPQAASLCRAIVQMGHVLGLKVVAEGVETSDQLALLLDCGVDLIQGYYYSKPLPGEEFCRYQKQNAASQ